MVMVTFFAEDICDLFAMLIFSNRVQENGKCTEFIYTDNFNYPGKNSQIFKIVTLGWGLEKSL